MIICRAPSAAFRSGGPLKCIDVNANAVMPLIQIRIKIIFEYDNVYKYYNDSKLTRIAIRVNYIPHVFLKAECTGSVPPSKNAASAFQISWKLLSFTLEDS